LSVVEKRSGNVSIGVSESLEVSRGIEVSSDSDGSLSVVGSDIDGSIGVGGITRYDQLVVRNGISRGSFQSDGESRNVEVVLDGQSTLNITSVAGVLIEGDDIEGIPVKEVCGGSSVAGGSVSGAVSLQLNITDSELRSTGGGNGKEGISRAISRGSRACFSNIAFSSRWSANSVGCRGNKGAISLATDSSVTLLSSIDFSISTDSRWGWGPVEGNVVELGTSGGSANALNQDLSIDDSVVGVVIGIGGQDGSKDVDSRGSKGGSLVKVEHDLVRIVGKVGSKVLHGGGGTRNVDDQSSGSGWGSHDQSVGGGKSSSSDGEVGLISSGCKGKCSIRIGNSSSGSLGSKLLRLSVQSSKLSLNQSLGTTQFRDGAIQDGIKGNSSNSSSIDDGSSIDLSSVGSEGSSSENGRIIIGVIGTVNRSEGNTSGCTAGVQIGLASNRIVSESNGASSCQSSLNVRV